MTIKAYHSLLGLRTLCSPAEHREEGDLGGREAPRMGPAESAPAIMWS